MRKLDQNEIIQTGNLGVFCPYWAKINNEVYIADTFEDIIKIIPKEDRVLDAGALASFLQFNYMMGDSTIVKNIKRIPWRAKLNSKGNITRQPEIPHDTVSLTPGEIAKKLLNLLEHEITRALKGYEYIYILLTGGLDSRIVAGIINKNKELLKSKVYSVTWGHQNSRDIHYANRIADWYGWEKINIPYDPILAKKNIYTGAIWGGSEVTGVHYHGVHWFKNMKPNSIAIAASFGDSIGRAEYSGTHLKNIKISPIINQQTLIRSKRFEKIHLDIERERTKAWNGANNSDELIIRGELDMEENYMRRMICHPLDYIRQYGAFYQAFTSDEVVSFMWSIDADSRTNEVYFELLKSLDIKLYSLPWARNGIAPSGAIETDQNLTKEYHEWVPWVQNELKTELQKWYFSETNKKLNIYNWKNLKKLWDRVINSNGNNKNWTENELIVKIASVAITCENFGIHSDFSDAGFLEKLKMVLKKRMLSG